MKKTKLLALALVLVLALALFAGCGKAEEPAAAEPTAAPAAEPTAAPDAEPAAEPAGEPTTDLEPIKIGHVCDLTGSEASAGEEAQRSLEFAIKALGGTIAGRPVEIIKADAQSATDIAVDVTRKLVEVDKVAAVFGPIQAGQKSAVAEYLKEAGVPNIAYSGTPAYVFNGNPWLVGAGGTNPQMNVIADYAYNELGYRTVHIMTMDNVGFRTFTDDFVTVFTALGGKIASEHYAPFPTSDWTSYFATLDTEADAIIAWTTGTNAIAFWRDWYQTGLSDKLPVTAVMQSAFTEYYIYNALSAIDPAIAEAALGIISPSAYVYDIDTPENEAFVERWVAEFGDVPASNLNGSCYQAVLLLKTAIESIDGETAPDKLIEALLASDVTGPTGHLFFDGSTAGVKDIFIVKSAKLDDGSYNNQIVDIYEDVPVTGPVVG